MLGVSWKGKDDCSTLLNVLEVYFGSSLLTYLADGLSSPTAVGSMWQLTPDNVATPHWASNVLRVEHTTGFQAFSIKQHIHRASNSSTCSMLKWEYFQDIGWN